MWLYTIVFVNIGSGNGLLPDGTKPLHQCWPIIDKEHVSVEFYSKLNHFYSTIYI